MKHTPPTVPSTRPRSARPWGRRLLVFIGLLGSLWVVGGELVRFVAARPYFALQHIVVHTDGRLSPTDIRRWSGLRAGRSVFELNLQQVETLLLDHDRVGQARVERRLPDAVHIWVETRRPVAVVRGSQLVYLDRHGSYFSDPELSAVRPALPAVSGLPDPRSDAPAARRVLDGVLRLLAASRLWREQLSEIRWDRDTGYSLFLARQQITLRVGRDPRPENLARVGRVLETWPANGPATVFDARFRNQVVVHPVPTAVQAVARGGAAEGEDDDA